MEEATKRSVIKGTPLINSMKQTLNVLTTVKLDCLPNANRIPRGNEQTIPQTPKTPKPHG